MSFVAVAIGASTIATVGVGLASASAQKNAANQNAALQQAQTAEDKRQYDQNRADLAPYRSVGTGALYKLSNLMGITPAQDTTGSAQPFDTGKSPNYAAYIDNNPDLRAAWDTNQANYQGRFGTPEAFAQWHYANFGAKEGRQLPYVARGDTAQAQADSTNPADFGSLDRSFTLADFNKDPGYDFRQAEGAKAVDNSAAARGGVLSGGALKAMARYGQDFASNEYGKAYDRFNNDNTTRFNRLSALAGTGQTATNQGIAAGNTLMEQQQQGVNNITSSNNAAANATSSAYAGIGSSIGNAANNFVGYKMMSGLYGGGGGAMTAAPAYAGIKA